MNLTSDFPRPGFLDLRLTQPWLSHRLQGPCSGLKVRSHSQNRWSAAGAARTGFLQVGVWEKC